MENKFNLILMFICLAGAVKNVVVPNEIMFVGFMVSAVLLSIREELLIIKNKD